MPSLNGPFFSRTCVIGKGLTFHALFSKLSRRSSRWALSAMPARGALLNTELGRSTPPATVAAVDTNCRRVIPSLDLIRNASHDKSWCDLRDVGAASVVGGGDIVLPCRRLAGRWVARAPGSGAYMHDIIDAPPAEQEKRSTDQSGTVNRQSQPSLPASSMEERPSTDQSAIVNRQSAIPATRGQTMIAEIFRKTRGVAQTALRLRLVAPGRVPLVIAVGMERRPLRLRHEFVPLCYQLDLFHRRRGMEMHGHDLLWPHRETISRAAAHQGPGIPAPQVGQGRPSMRQAHRHFGSPSQAQALGEAHLDVLTFSAHHLDDDVA